MKLQLLALLLIWPVPASLELTARDSIVYSKVELDTFVKSHPGTDVTSQMKARDAVTDQLTVYCGSVAYLSGGKCQKPKDKIVRNRIAASLKNSLALLDSSIEALEKK